MARQRVNAVRTFSAQDMAQRLRRQELTYDRVFVAELLHDFEKRGLVARVGADCFVVTAAGRRLSEGMQLAL
jgi:hypothetical protein